MIWRRDAVLTHALDCLRDTNARLAEAIGRQSEVEMARVALERERFAYERAKDAKAEAEREAWKAEQEGTDLPAVVTQTITELAGADRALKAQLVRFARLRHGRNIEAAMIVAELRRGDTAARG